MYLEIQLLQPGRHTWKKESVGQIPVPIATCLLSSSETSKGTIQPAVVAESHRFRSQILFWIKTNKRQRERSTDPP